MRDTRSSVVAAAALARGQRGGHTLRLSQRRRRHPQPSARSSAGETACGVRPFLLLASPYEALASATIVAPGALIGEDPEPSEQPTLIFDNPYDMAVAIIGTPDELRALVARLVQLSAETSIREDS